MRLQLSEKISGKQAQKLLALAKEIKIFFTNHVLGNTLIIWDQQEIKTISFCPLKFHIQKKKKSTNFRRRME